MSRYEIILKQNNEKYINGSPVLIAKSALLKDNNTGNILLQVKYQRISNAKIIGLTISVDAFDIKGEKLEGIQNYQYLDIKHAKKTFGDDVAIRFPDSNTRKYEIHILDVVLEDEQIWTNQGEPCEDIPENSSINNLIKDDIWTNEERNRLLEKSNESYLDFASELEKQYQILLGNDAKYLYKEYKDLWYCSCGEINKSDFAKCTCCGNDKESVKKNSDLSILKQKMEARLEEEGNQKRIALQEAERVRQEQEELERKRKEEHDKKVKRIKKIIKQGVIICFIVAVISGAVYGGYRLVVDYIQPNNKYNAAVKLLEEEKFDEAKKEFEELGEYKDSQDKVLESDYLKAKKYYSEGLFLETYQLLFDKWALREYKDSKELREQAMNSLIQKNVEEGKILLKEKKYQKAYEILSEHPSDIGNELIAQSYEQRAQLCFKQKKYAKAYNLMKKVYMYDSKLYYKEYAKYSKKMSDIYYSKKKYLKAKELADEAGDENRRYKAEYAYVKSKNKPSDKVAMFLAELVKNKYKDAEALNNRLYKPYVTVRINTTGEYSDGNQKVYASEYSYNKYINIKLHGVNDYLDTEGIKIKYTLSDNTGWSKTISLSGRFSNTEESDEGGWMIPNSGWNYVKVYNKETGELLGSKSFYVH